MPLGASISSFYNFILDFSYFSLFRGLKPPYDTVFRSFSCVNLVSQVQENTATKYKPNQPRSVRKHADKYSNMTQNSVVPFSFLYMRENKNTTYQLPSMGYLGIAG